MIKMWGRNTSSNVQKAMWAVGELGLECNRIDVGGAFGKNKEPEYLAMNPNGLVPVLEEEDVSAGVESIARYLASKHDKAVDGRKTRHAALPISDGLAVVGRGPAITPAFWGLIRTPEDNGTWRDQVIADKPSSQCRRSTRNRLRPNTCRRVRTATLVGVMVYRYRQLVPDRPATPQLERWYAAISKRKAFHDHVGSIPLT